MNEITTRQALIQYVKTKLGDPVINLEFTDDMITDNIDDSIQNFTRWSGDATYRSALVLVLTAGVDTYSLDQFDPYIENLIRFDISGFSNGIHVLFSPMNILYQSGAFSFLNGGSWDLTSFELGMQYLELIKTMLTTDFFLEYNKYTNTVKVTPTPTLEMTNLDYYQNTPNNTMAGVLEFYSKRDPGQGNSKIYNELWIKNYTLALSKMNLGFIWGKYNGTPLPGGGTLNAATIMQQGEKDRDKLLEELPKQYGDPLEFFFESIS